MRLAKVTAAIALSIIVAAGCLTPAFAYVPYDPYDEEEDTEEVALPTFSTTWFDNHQRDTEFTLYTSSQVEGLAYLVNQSHFDGYVANKYESFRGKTIKLGRDITIRDTFTPIGRSEDVCFEGIFDGNGHSITVDINENGGYTGFFGYLNGTVRNLTVKGNVRSSGNECGALAGHLGSKGVIKKCVSDADVKGGSKTGGIVGYNKGGSIERCVNNGDVRGTFKVGGVVGENWGSVIKCGNRGKVVSTERGATTYGTGGVCGRSVSPDSIIEECFNTGNVISGTEGTGGICGYMNAKGSKIVNSYNTGHIKVNNNKLLSQNGIRGYAGGIVGIAGVKGVVLSNCYNAGSIVNSDISGGIIGDYLDESKFTDDPYISNNYYLSINGVKGIGSDNEGDSKNIREGTDRIAQATLISGSSKLGETYIDDSQNYYGANGFPALRWQKKLGKVKTTRLPCITAGMQKEFDQYIQKNPAYERPEWPVLIFFNHSAFSSQAIGDFHEEQLKKYTH